MQSSMLVLSLFITLCGQTNSWAATKITGSGRLTTYRGPERLDREISVDYEFTWNLNKYAVRVLQSEERARFKSLVVSDCTDTYLAITVGNAPGPNGTNPNRPRGKWANGKMVSGPLPNSEEHYWNVPQVLGLAWLCLQQPDRVISGAELKADAIPTVISKMAERNSLEVRTNVLRAPDRSVEAVQFYFLVANSGNAKREPVLHGELKILQQEDGSPVKISFVRWGYLQNSVERYVASEYHFEGHAVPTDNTDVFQMIAYDPECPVTFRDSRFPRSLVNLQPREPPPFLGSSSQQRLVALLEAQAKTAANNRIKRIAIVSMIGISGGILLLIVFRRKTRQ